MGKSVSAERSDTNGLIVLKWAQHRPITIPNLDELPRQQTMVTIDTVRAMILENRHLTVRETAEEVDVGVASLTRTASPQNS